MTDRVSSTPLARRLAVFGPAAIVLIVGALSFGALRRSLGISQWVLHSRYVLDASSSLLNGTLEAESAQRGFLASHDSTVLEPYSVAPARVDSLIRRLRELTRDNAGQQARIDTLTDRVRERFAWIDSSVNIPAVTSAIVSRSGPLYAVEARAARRHTNSEVRRLIDAIDATEDQLLRDREERERQSMSLTWAVLVIGTIAAAILALLANRSLDTALLERRAALEEAEDANTQLQEQAVELETQAEVSEAAAYEAEQASDEARSAQRAAHESEQRAERLQAATEAFSGALALAEVAQLIVDQAMAALDADSGALGAYHASSAAMQFVAVRNVSTASVGHTIAISDDGPMTSSIRNAQPVIVSTEDVLRTAFPGLAAAHAMEAVQSVAAFPLSYGGQVLGSLLVRWKGPRTLGSVDVSFMNALSRIAAESFDRARLFDAEREARTEAEGANRAKAAFLASMSHELRTPLQAALGFAQLVRSEVYGPINEAQAEALGRVERSQTHLARLIDDILDFARLEAGRVRLKLEPVTVADVFNDLVPLIEPQASTKNVELRFSPPPACLPRARRPPASAASDGEPRRQRDQVHVGARNDSRHGATGGAARAAPGVRQWRGHSRGPARGHLRAVRAGGRHAHAHAAWDRTRPRDQS